MDNILIYVLIAIVVLVIIIAKKALVIISQSETKIVERLGKYYATLNPGYQLYHPIHRPCQGNRRYARWTLYLQ